MINAGWIIVLFLGLILVCGEMTEKGKKVPVFQENVATESEENLSAMPQEETEQEETEYEVIEPSGGGTEDASIRYLLSAGSSEFYQNYPIDEAFLCWVGGEYGSEVLVDLASQLEEGKADSDLWYRFTGRSMHVLWLDYCRAHNYATYLWEDVVWKETADMGSITIDFVGDINFDDNWCTMEAAEKAGGVENCISSDVKTELQSADLTVVNNEFTYTESDEATANKSYTFKAAPSDVGLLDIFGTDLVTLANNHTYDYGKQGLLDTLDTLENAGIPYIGAGRNIWEASAVRYFVMGGRKIAFVSASEIERFYHYTKAATAEEPGVLKTQQEEIVCAAIADAAARSDYVIAYIHWGGEGSVQYDSGQQKLAEAYVKAGASAVIGSHPHRLQGVTFYKNVPIAYSLGNFWFSTGTLYTTIAQIHIDDTGELTLSMLPCIQKDLKTSMLSTEEERKEFYHYLADISSNVGIDENGRIISYKDVVPGESPYAYTSGRRYGMHFDDSDLEGRPIDIIGNLE